MRINAAVAVVMFMAAPVAADERYASEVVAADGAALVTTIAGHRAEEPIARDIGMAAGILGAPLVHLAEGNTRGALKSLALRVTLPVALAWATDQVLPVRPLCGCSGEDPIQPSHVMGFVVGLVAASAIDASVFAKKQTQREWAPTVVVRHGGAQVGFAATF